MAHNGKANRQRLRRQTGSPPPGPVRTYKVDVAKAKAAGLWPPVWPSAYKMAKEAIRRFGVETTPPEGQEGEQG